MITGRFDYKGFSEQAWKNFWFKIRENELDTIERFLSHVKDSLDDWEEDLATALSDYLPEQFWHIQRPRAEYRDFPYMNTGVQSSNVKTELRTKRKGDRLYATAWGSIDVPYAYYTNIGKPARKKGSPTPGWVGWVNAVFEGHGRGNVTSLSDMFDQLMIERKML